MPDGNGTAIERTGGTGPHAGRPVESEGPPLGDARAAMVMVHGRNASARNILDLARVLGHPTLACLAPAASGNTWYPHSFLAERSSNEPGLSSGLSVIGELVDGIVTAGVPRERVLLLGFSQGACLASEFVYRNPDRYGGLIVFSGGLIGPPGTAWEAEGELDGTPVFLGCSDVDHHIPKERVNESAAVFRGMGAQVTERIYPGMGHLVNEDEIAFARGLVTMVTDD